jgi:hypothetical protein
MALLVGTGKSLRREETALDFPHQMEVLASSCSRTPDSSQKPRDDRRSLHMTSSIDGPSHPAPRQARRAGRQSGIIGNSGHSSPGR